jgi:alpha-beta hydrolase superfamily lysophospholipase
LSGNNFTFAKIAQTFDSQTVVGLEYPGHGRSSGQRGELPPAEHLLSDIVDAVLWILEESNKPFILCGHSMGGLLCLLVGERLSSIKRMDLRGIVLLAPAIDTLVDGAFDFCHCFGGTSRHCCSLIAPTWCGIYYLMKCLVLQLGVTALLPKEDAAKYTGMPAAEKLQFTKSLAVTQMKASAVITLLDLMSMLQQQSTMYWEPVQAVGRTEQQAIAPTPTAASAAPATISSTRPIPAPILMISAGCDWAIPKQSLRSFAAACNLEPWPVGWSDEKAESTPLKGRSFELHIAEATHSVLMGDVRWAHGEDAAHELALPAIRAWADAQAS